MKFNTPPGWPPPPAGWVPDATWSPDPSWPPAPPGWNFWVPHDTPTATAPVPAVPTPPEPAATEAPPAPSSLFDDQPPAAADAAPEERPQPPVVLPPEPPSADLAENQQELADLRRQLEEEHQVSAALREQIAAAAAQPADNATATTPGTDSGSIDEDLEAARRELVELNDAVLLQQVGIYDYHHPLENADAYKARLADIRERIKDSVRTKAAIEASDRFAYNNSLAQGRKMTGDFSKLMLRAYNAEADNCVRSLRAGSIAAAIKRLNGSVETIARLGSMMEMRVSPEYHALRVEELELTSDYLFKVQEEREEAREERERLREERKAEQELAAERERLDKERSHYENTIASLREQGKEDEAAELEQRVAQIDDAIAQNDFRAANIRAGYVYVISNIGAFGPNVVKIGLTRRLEPMDRVRELGDASVPFPFDVHAIYFSDDAVQLENELHAAFAAMRVNLVNLRREFFFATPTEVRDVLATKVGNLLEFTEAPEATQYFQSHGSWPVVTPGPAGAAAFE